MFRLSYWLLPVFSGATWLGMLLGMLISWAVDDHRKRYSSMKANQSVAYISDIGADRLKPMFIACCSVTVVALDLSFLADRWLRHRGRLTPNGSTGQKVLAVLTIVFAIAGAAGLILLSVFDVAHHKSMHDGFLLLFLGGYVLSAICICWEYQRLGIHNRHLRILRVSFWIKLSFVLIEVVLAIAFVAQTFTHKPTGGAIVEWIIAFIFSFYVFSFSIDLYPAVRTRPPRHIRNTHSYEYNTPGIATTAADGHPSTSASNRYSGAPLGADRQLDLGGFHGGLEMEEGRGGPDFDVAYGQSAARATRPSRQNMLDFDDNTSAANASSRTDLPTSAFQPGRSYGHRQELSGSSL